MRRTKVGLAVFAATFCLGQAHAQWAVFDSTNYANAVKEYRQVQQLYTTATQTRDQVIQTYNLARQMAQMPQDLYQRYGTEFARWKTVSASSTYGNTGEWILAANGDRVSADAGYRTATIQLVQPPQTALAKLDERSQQFVKVQYATAELADGVSVTALSTLGDIHARSVALDRKIDQLATDSYSRDPNQQTQMAVLGKINTATLMQLRSQQDTNQILTTAALHQMLTAKEQFDQQKRALNQAIYFQQNFRDSMNQITGGMTRSMQSISFGSSR
jgi:hypothetical protein